jgi:hypothetical protein
MFTQAKAWAEFFLALRAVSEDSEGSPALLKDSAARRPLDDGVIKPATRANLRWPEGP